MSAESDRILAQLQSVGAEFREKQPGAREQLIKLCRELISSLELPSEAIQRIGWAEPARAAHCRIAVDLKIPEHLKESGTAGISAQALAAKIGADDVLIARTMRHLAAMKIVAENGVDTYVATGLSNALTDPKYRDGIIYTYDVAGRSFRALPEYLKKTSYALPTDLTNGPFQHAHKTDLPFFAWLDQNPPYLEKFNNYMSAYRAGKPSWLDPGFYPIQERLINGFEPTYSDVMLVDVGGGLGHDLRELKEKHPSLPGRLVLQDRPEVISSLASTGETVFDPTSHDFFTEQPVKNARTYYLHSVLHDWGDDDCIKILQQLKPAMKAGYSRLLINELVVPGQNAPWSVTSMDQLVFVLGAMRERTEADWKSVLERAGFRNIQIHSFAMGSEVIIEAELA
ncbi:unnamed protein product [Clonostachys rhizophaga]|uniref:O-methyltransferase domain-containing protein n=1 Tax=Clonostachys rhizophaga TaxID=160324 RepID=A0A9N9V968_9HYPO|nr:unnamed protein product [Clonostachys rhizophaga]